MILRKKQKNVWAKLVLVWPVYPKICLIGCVCATIVTEIALFRLIRDVPIILLLLFSKRFYEKNNPIFTKAIRQNARRKEDKDHYRSFWNRKIGQQARFSPDQNQTVWQGTKKEDECVFGYWLVCTCVLEHRYMDKVS